MKKIIAFLIVAIVTGASLAYAQSATEKEVIQAVVDADAYLRANLTNSPDAYSKLGALEFWSSGGLMQEIEPGAAPEEYDAFNVYPRYIGVIPLVEGQAAVAVYYAEGSMKPKGAPAVNHYLTRVTQVFVKEDGKWKVRASHFSPLAGGSGTTQTTTEP